MTPLAIAVCPDCHSHSNDLSGAAAGEFIAAHRVCAPNQSSPSTEGERNANQNRHAD